MWLTREAKRESGIMDLVAFCKAESLALNMFIVKNRLCSVSNILARFIPRFVVYWLGPAPESPS